MADHILPAHQHGLPTAVWSLLGYVWETYLLLHLHCHLHGRVLWLFGRPDHAATQYDASLDRIRWRRPDNDG